MSADKSGEGDEAGADPRAVDLHDHGRMLATHGKDLAAVHGKGLADHGKELSAHAFTTGNDVLFKPGTPDLHTAAHEAAYVVQQRGGVHM